MKKTFVLLLAIALSACSALSPKVVSSSDLGIEEQLVFKASVDATLQMTKQVLADKGWKLSYEGTEPPREYDRIARDATLSSAIRPKQFLQAKTPISAFSFGAELLVLLYEAPDNGCIVSVTAGTTQVLEKKRLEGYIVELAKQLNQNLK
jgi:hypothetical protein